MTAENDLLQRNIVLASHDYCGRARRSCGFGVLARETALIQCWKKGRVAFSTQLIVQGYRTNRQAA